MADIPGKECEGYPSTSWLSPTNEIDFYISDKKKKIACSLIYNDDQKARTSSYDLANGNTANIQRFLRRTDKSKPIFVICHGHLSWRNQMLFVALSKKLNEVLGYPMLRFDFGGNGHSNGDWKFAAYDENYCDLCTVVNYIHTTLQCRIGCIIAHSQGVVTSMKYASRHNNTHGSVPKYVNLAGRFHIPESPLQVAEKRLSSEQFTELERKGAVTILKRGNKNKIYRITLEDIKRHAEYDTSSIFSNFPDVEVLTIHGNADKHVPVDNAIKFEHALKDRHTKRIISGADHNFNGMRHIDEIAFEIKSFYLKQ